MTRVLVQWIVALTVSALVMGAVLAGAARAQTGVAQEAAGDWHGAIHLPTGDHRLALEITGKPGAYAGRLLSPEVTDTWTALSDVKVADGRLSFALPAIRATYLGRWDAAAHAWVGQWTQGIDYPVTFETGKLPPRPVIAGLDGVWSGAVMSGAGTKLRILLRIHTSASGTIVLMDVPDQLAAGIPIPTLARDGQKVTFDLKAARASYEGQLSADGKSLTGTWTQGVAMPLNFTWSAPQTAVARRPQTPVKPYPYREEEVAIASAPGVTLAGTLTLPPGKGPFAAAVMITGSGAEDRDETIMGHKPFAVIADRLTRDGIAVLRVDDRGFGKSTGDYVKASTQDFAVDAAAQVAWLRKRPDIDPRRVGLIGHSEGGLIGPMVAARDPRIAFVVMMAGPGAPLGEVLAAQRAALAPGMGIGKAQLDQSQALVDRAVVAMHGAKDQADAEARALAVLTPAYAALGQPQGAVMAAKQLSSPEMRNLMEYDPRPTLAQVKAPILALNGSKDMQVPADMDLDAIRDATKANKDVTIVKLPGLNHLFQTAPTGAVGEYADIEETVAPIALDTMSAWIVKHTRAAARR
ncbi:MAG: alpha/beta hydrolase family protein [Phenylobacterium sp.]